MSTRSTDPATYQDVPRPVAVMPKEFEPGARTGSHHHARAQLLYAVSGVMVATTERGSWAVTTGHALWIPPQIVHDIAMHGPVSMRTAYIVPAEGLPATCSILRVTDLLDASLRALGELPVLYDRDGRAGHLEALILDEIRNAEPIGVTLPVAADPRLRRLCEALLLDPSLALDLDGWADRIGMSRRTLTRRFRAETGLSFADWRRRLRALRALQHEAAGGQLHAAASRVGYRSPRALRVMMRRLDG